MKDELKKLIELQNKATPEWHYVPSDDFGGPRVHFGSQQGGVMLHSSTPNADANAQLMEAARNFDFKALDAKIKRYEDALCAMASLEMTDAQRKERARKALDSMATVVGQDIALTCDWKPIDRSSPIPEVTSDLTFGSGCNEYYLCNLKTGMTTLVNFLIHVTDWNDDTEYADHEGSWFYAADINPTHWMPLPKPPKE